MSDQSKACLKCGVVKPATPHFFFQKGIVNGRRDLHACCKACRKGQMSAWQSRNTEKKREIQRRYRLAHPEKVKERWRIWKEQNYERVMQSEKSRRERDKEKIAARIRSTSLSRLYGITVQEYDRMLADQSGGCAICGKSARESSRKKLCVDHDHGSGKVRGLLCFECNVGIGNFKEDAILLQKAVSYLRRSAWPASLSA